MSFDYLILGRFSQQGAQDINDHGMQHAFEAFAAAVGQPPANGTITAWYAADSHDWDIAVIGRVDNDDPAYWAKAQIRGRTNGLFEKTYLVRLASLDAFDASRL